MSRSKAREVRICVLHEGSIVHLELNLVSPFYSVISAPSLLLAASLPREKHCLYLTESSSDLGANGSIRGRPEDDLYQTEEMEETRLKLSLASPSAGIFFFYNARKMNS